MAGSTLVVPHQAPLTDEQSRATLAEVQAGTAAGMAASAERQSHAAEPMAGALAMPAEPALQPLVAAEKGGVT